jgi:hypothetical protein
MSVLQALDAASKLHTMWVLPSQSSRQRLQLLQQPPPAVCSGPVQVAVSSTWLLLGAVSTGVSAAAALRNPQKADELIEIITNHRIHQISADLMAWLQQRPELITHPGSEGDSPHYTLWFCCTQCIAAVAELCAVCEVEERAVWATDLAYVLDAAGEEAAAAVVCAPCCR